MSKKTKLNLVTFLLIKMNVYFGLPEIFNQSGSDNKIYSDKEILLQHIKHPESKIMTDEQMKTNLLQQINNHRNNPLLVNENIHMQLKKDFDNYLKNIENDTDTFETNHMSFFSYLIKNRQLLSDITYAKQTINEFLSNNEIKKKIKFNFDKILYKKIFTYEKYFNSKVDLKQRFDKINNIRNISFETFIKDQNEKTNFLLKVNQLNILSKEQTEALSILQEFNKNLQTQLSFMGQIINMINNEQKDDITIIQNNLNQLQKNQNDYILNFINFFTNKDSAKEISDDIGSDKKPQNNILKTKKNNQNKNLHTSFVFENEKINKEFKDCLSKTQVVFHNYEKLNDNYLNSLKGDNIDFDESEFNDDDEFVELNQSISENFENHDASIFTTSILCESIYNDDRNEDVDLENNDLENNDLLYDSCSSSDEEDDDTRKQFSQDKFLKFIRKPKQSKTNKLNQSISENFEKNNKKFFTKSIVCESIYIDENEKNKEGDLVHDSFSSSDKKENDINKQFVSHNFLFKKQSEKKNDISRSIMEFIDLGNSSLLKTDSNIQSSIQLIENAITVIPNIEQSYFILDVSASNKNIISDISKNSQNTMLKISENDLDLENVHLEQSIIINENDSISQNINISQSVDIDISHKIEFSKIISENDSIIEESYSESDILNEDNQHLLDNFQSNKIDEEINNIDNSNPINNNRNFNVFLDSSILLSQYKQYRKKPLPEDLKFSSIKFNTYQKQFQANLNKNLIIINNNNNLCDKILSKIEALSASKTENVSNLKLEEFKKTIEEYCIFIANNKLQENFDKIINNSFKNKYLTQSSDLMNQNTLQDCLNKINEDNYKLLDLNITNQTQKFELKKFYNKFIKIFQLINDTVSQLNDLSFQNIELMDVKSSIVDNNVTNHSTLKNDDDKNNDLFFQNIQSKQLIKGFTIAKSGLILSYEKIDNESNDEINNVIKSTKKNTNIICDDLSSSDEDEEEEYINQNSRYKFLKFTKHQKQSKIQKNEKKHLNIIDSKNNLQRKEFKKNLLSLNEIQSIYVDDQQNNDVNTSDLFNQNGIIESDIISNNNENDHINLTKLSIIKSQFVKSDIILNNNENDDINQNNQFLNQDELKIYQNIVQESKDFLNAFQQQLNDIVPVIHENTQLQNNLYISNLDNDQSIIDHKAIILLKEFFFNNDLKNPSKELFNNVKIKFEDLKSLLEREKNKLFTITTLNTQLKNELELIKKIQYQKENIDENIKLYKKQLIEVNNLLKINSQLLAFYTPMNNNLNQEKIDTSVLYIEQNKELELQFKNLENDILKINDIDVINNKNNLEFIFNINNELLVLNQSQYQLLSYIKENNAKRSDDINSYFHFKINIFNRQLELFDKQLEILRYQIKENNKEFNKDYSTMLQNINTELNFIKDLYLKFCNSKIYEKIEHLNTNKKLIESFYKRLSLLNQQKNDLETKII